MQGPVTHLEYDGKRLNLSVGLSGTAVTRTLGQYQISDPSREYTLCKDNNWLPKGSQLLKMLYDKLITI
jgi:hypothetical protein